MAEKCGKKCASILIDFLNEIEITREISNDIEHYKLTLTLQEYTPYYKGEEEHFFNHFKTLIPQLDILNSMCDIHTADINNNIQEVQTQFQKHDLRFVDDMLQAIGGKVKDRIQGKYSRIGKE